MIAAYIGRTTGAYPLSILNVRGLAGVGFGEEPTPDVLDLADVDPVERSVPEYDYVTQRVVAEGQPVKVGGIWRQTWIIENSPTPDLRDAVDAERDRRITGGVTFDGVRYQTRAGDRENIMGAFALANAALTVGGKQPGDLRWHDGVEDFVFIAEDNSRVPMDAVTVLRLGQAAARQKSDNTFAANDLKLADPIPPDFADDAYWPAR